MASLLSITPGAPTNFNPRNIAGLQLYLDFNDTTKINGGSITDGTGITGIIDKSTNAYTWTQGTGARQPIWKAGIINGKSVARFNNQVLLGGSEQYLQTGSAYEVVTVQSVTTDQTNRNNDLFWVKSNGNATHNPGFGYRTNAGVPVSEFFGTATSGWIAGGAVGLTYTTGSFHYWNWEYSGTGSTTFANFTFYYDNTSKGSPSSNAAATGDVNGNFLGNYLNGSDSGFCFIGDLALVLIYQHQFTSLERSQLYAWIKQQYATP